MRPTIAALVALVLVALLVVPFHPEAHLMGVAYQIGPPALQPFVWDAVEWGGNILSFALLTAAFCFAIRPRYAFLLATAISVVCELAQIVIPDRQPRVSDVLLNVIGAAIGAGICAGIAALHRASRRRRSAVRSTAH